MFRHIIPSSNSNTQKLFGVSLKRSYLATLTVEHRRTQIQICGYFFKVACLFVFLEILNLHFFSCKQLTNCLILVRICQSIPLSQWWGLKLYIIPASTMLAATAAAAVTAARSRGTGMSIAQTIKTVPTTSLSDRKLSDHKPSPSVSSSPEWGIPFERSTSQKHTRTHTHTRTHANTLRLVWVMECVAIASTAAILGNYRSCYSWEKNGKKSHFNPAVTQPLAGPILWLGAIVWVKDYILKIQL